jgi:hypothetical protein
MFAVAELKAASQRTQEVVSEQEHDLTLRHNVKTIFASLNILPQSKKKFYRI